MHYKIEVNLSLSPSATYNTIEANIIKKSCQEFVDTALCISEAMFVTTPTNFTPANPLKYPKFPRHVRAEIGRRLFREKNPLGTTEPWTRSSEENVVCPRTMRYPRDLPPPLCPIRDVGSVESVVQFQPRWLKVKLVVSRFSVNEKFSSRMQPRLSRAITGLIMEIGIPEWF